MENDDHIITAKDVEPHIAEPVASLNTAHSTSKLSPNELSPDSTSEIENSVNKIERQDPFVACNKVNGDCVLECSVSSHPIVPTNTNNNNMSAPTLKISSEKNDCDLDESLSRDFLKKEIIPEESVNGSKVKSKNVSPSATLHNEHLLQPPDDRTFDSERSQIDCVQNSNVTVISSTLEEKCSSETNEILAIKPAISKAKRQASDFSSSGSSKTNENFKPTSRHDLKSKKSSDCENNQKQLDTSNKTVEKIGRNNKRKNEEKLLNSNEVDFNDLEKFPIQYKGFKKKTSNNYEKHRPNLRWNPFNPACKPNRKFNKCMPSRHPVGDEIDCSTLQQSEYAQYLGLQPILKFRCSNCGSSAFQSMVALNTHQIECTKSGRRKLDKTPMHVANSIAEPKSTNIKLTRKVFLCSACGTYYEHWNLFLHMREVHRRYICLYCLGMFSIAEKLSEHLIQKHKITHQNFTSLENFQKHSYQTFFLLCLTCDKVFSEIDNFYGHVCATNKKSIDTNESSNKSEFAAGQDSNIIISNDVTNGGNKSHSKRLKEANKKVATAPRSLQVKKDEGLVGVPSQRLEDVRITESKEVKSDEVIATCSSGAFTSSCLNENTHSDCNTQNQNEVELNEHDTKLQESQASAENLPTLEKSKQLKKSKPVSKKSATKRKKMKDDDCDASSSKLKKILEDAPLSPEPQANLEVESDKGLVSTSENNLDGKDELISDVHSVSDVVEPMSDVIQETNTKTYAEEVCKNETENNSEENKSVEVKKEELEAPKEELSDNSTSASIVETKTKLQTNLLKFKLPGVESDGESDDSQKLSLVVDENANSDAEHKNSPEGRVHGPTECESAVVHNIADYSEPKGTDSNSYIQSEGGQDITLASEDVAVMALTLDDKIENIPIQTVLKECVRTSCMSCNYCRHAVKIAVNGKQLAIHILSEHRFMPIKNETPDDVIKKLKSSLTNLQAMFFNTETYDSSDPTIHVPYDQDSSFDCFQCNYVTSSHRDLFAHKRKSHTKSLLLCIMCKSNFYSYSELLCHLCPGTYNAEVQFHNVDINFRCCFCRLDTIPSAFRLMVHLRKTHHTCDICLENGVDQQKLSTHMWKHKLNHLCYRCGIAYASKPDITKHLFWKHGHESVLCKKCLQKKWPHVYHFCIPPTSFICEECNTSFSKAVALKVHKRIHGNDFPYMCSECNKKFVSKKLLQRHEERHIAIKNNEENNPEHNQEEAQKEEIINVADVISENKEASVIISDSKESEPKDRSHKKHKKDKDKKDKQVVDVYDLPPLNLSSDSDSSDEDTLNDNCVSSVNLAKTDEDKSEQKYESKETENNSISLQNEDEISLSQVDNIIAEKDDKMRSPAAHDASDNSIDETKCFEEEDKLDEVDNINPIGAIQADDVDIINPSRTDWKPEREDENLENTAPSESAESNKEVEDIWKNFYNTNPQNSNLPYPLCAIKSEIALDIIMGDHDYCHQPPVSFSFREDIPSTSGISGPLINDNLEEDIDIAQEKLNELSAPKVGTSASPLNSPKKKPKSPKKKSSKGENENNSSSSSDSSSESSSSSCSCGPNCSCSSTSSNSSSSSSTDSESSAGEEGVKQERKRKKRERRSKGKSDHESELAKEQTQSHSELSMPVEPVDPPIRESELETDETTTDEEFYDQQPQRIANQLLAEKRNQLMLLASAANANNGNSSPSPLVDVLQPEVLIPSKQKVKNKRKRKITAKGKTISEKYLSNSHPYSQYSKDNEQSVKQVPQYHSNILLPTDQKVPSFVVQTPVSNETPGSGSETEKSRSSKRRRIPNKFYGYSSGDDEEKPTPSPKWRKQDTAVVSQQSRVQPIHPPTPRIQLTVPKQVIRKPYKLQKPIAKQQPSSSDSTDSGSEMESQPTPHIPPAVHHMSTSAVSQKSDKDVYCYCRCPYDEVSEMIACDDENCEIEWFHFECVGILVPPRGQWFCPGCRKARGLPT